MRKMPKAAMILLAVAVFTAIAVVVGLAAMSRRPPSLTSYFFDTGKFERVEKGFTEDQVRELIGPPLFRENWQDGSCCWQYAVMPAAANGEDGLHECTERYVHFGGDGRVLQRSESRFISHLDAKSSRYPLIGPRPPGTPHRLERFDLPMVQGNAPAPSDSYLIQVMASWCPGCTEQRPKVEHLTAARKLPLVLVSIDEDTEALRHYLTEHLISAPVAANPRQTMPGFKRKNGIPQYGLVQNGYVFWFHFDVPNESAAYSDLEWLLGDKNLTRFVPAGGGI